MQIIAGAYKSRQLKTPKGRATRPSSSRLREALFNILQGTIEGACFLDLFAGSGAVGLEALSRGAREAVFIEKEREAARCIKQNIAALEVGGRASLFTGDLFSLLGRLRKSFDIIFADPPYESGPLSGRLLQLIDETELLKPGGLFLLEESEKTAIEAEGLKSLSLLERRRFGTSALLQFKKND